MSEPLDSLQHEVDVLFLDRLIGDNAPEEVGVLAEGLVADHDRTLGHHTGFDLSCHLSNKSKLLKADKTKESQLGNNKWTYFLLKFNLSDLNTF